MENDSILKFKINLRQNKIKNLDKFAKELIKIKLLKDFTMNISSNLL
jgi:hypothetical protein